MKHKISKLLIIFLLLSNLPACIEVKDQDEEPKVMVQVIEGGDLKIEEPLYLIEGEFLRESELPNTEKSQSRVSDYEYRFSNLELGPNGVLYTLGNNVSIKAQNLISRGGVIASFPEGRESSQGDGLRGGDLKVWSQSAQGNLKVVMRGENGKQGEPGDAPLETMKGSTGGEGVDVATSSDGRILVFATPGKRGGTGKPGFPGKNGFSGGSSGTFEFTAIQDQSLYLSLEIIGGKGGAGGPGGMGGEGGDGGRGGSLGRTKRADFGPPGAVGPQGEVGVPGTGGHVETACVSVAGIMECNQQSFNYSR